jgi:hypothetical protein
MLAVAAQLPAEVLANERSDVAGRALEPSELEAEASTEAARARTAHVADATELMLTTKPPLLASMIETRIGERRRADVTKA